MALVWLALAACAPEGRAVSELPDGALAAASLVTVSSAGQVTVSPIALVDGALPAAVARPDDGPGARFLLSVSRAALEAMSPLVDLERLAEARIRTLLRQSCGAEGEVLDGRITLSLRDQVVVHELPEGASGPARRLALDSPKLAWLSGLQLDTPALAAPHCRGAPNIVLRRVFAEGEAIFPEGATVAGLRPEANHHELVELEVLADGRILALSSSALYLRDPSEPYRDHESMVRRVRGNEIDTAKGRGAMLLVEDGPDGSGETWVVVTSSTAERRLEAVRFDATGLTEQRVLSRINPPEPGPPDLSSPGDVTRLRQLPDGRLVAVTAGGGGLVAPGPAGPWTSVTLGEGFARVLEPLPGEPGGFLATDKSRAYLWRPLDEPPKLLLVGEAPPTVDLFGGLVERDGDGALHITVVGNFGMLASKSSAALAGPWTRDRFVVPPPEGPTRRCSGPPICGRSEVFVTIWDAQPLELAGERWLLLGLDSCAEVVVMRRRDGCAFFAELEGGAQPEAEVRSSRRIVNRKGRWFRLGTRGLIRELVVR